MLFQKISRALRRTRELRAARKAHDDEEILASMDARLKRAADNLWEAGGIRHSRKHKPFRTPDEEEILASMPDTRPAINARLKALEDEAFGLCEAVVTEGSQHPAPEIQRRVIKALRTTIGAVSRIYYRRTPSLMDDLPDHPPVHERLLGLYETVLRHCAGVEAPWAIEEAASLIEERLYWLRDCKWSYQVSDRDRATLLLSFLEALPEHLPAAQEAIARLRHVQSLHAIAEDSLADFFRSPPRGSEPHSGADYAAMAESLFTLLERCFREHDDDALRAFAVRAFDGRKRALRAQGKLDEAARCQSDAALRYAADAAPVVRATWVHAALADETREPATLSTITNALTVLQRYADDGDSLVRGAVIRACVALAAHAQQADLNDEALRASYWALAHYATDAAPDVLAAFVTPRVGRGNLLRLLGRHEEANGCFDAIACRGEPGPRRRGPP